MFPLPHRNIGRIRAVITVAALTFAGLTRAADFNGDGIDDLLFRDRTDTDSRIVLALGRDGEPAGGERKGMLLADDESRRRGFDVRTGDFDGDGKTDVLTRDLANGEIRIRLMNGAAVRDSRLINGPPRTPRVPLVAVADFDGDRRDDLLMRNRKTGVWSIWLMNGLEAKMEPSGPSRIVRAGWRFAATADFDGNGRSDLLLHNGDTGEWRMVRLNGRDITHSNLLRFLPRSRLWHLEAIEDMNRDGRADLLFRQRSTGSWRSYLLAGATLLPESGAIAISKEREWRLQLLEDLNGDGFRDALLSRHDNAQWRVDFLMHGQRLEGSGVVARKRQRKARIAAAGDYDGDGVHEVLIRHPTGWRVTDLRNPAEPRAVRLELPRPRRWSHACEPPNYRQFSQRRKPRDLEPSTAFVTWQLPVRRENGEALCADELAGFELRYAKTGSGNVRSIRLLNPLLDVRRIRWLGSGEWWFRIFTVDSDGRASPASRAATKIVP